MKQVIFALLAQLNRIFLPKYSRRDLTKLSNVDKALIGYRTWVTKNVLK